MALLSDIINELVDSNQSLEAPLLKTKVLASRLKNTALLDWVDKELSGYPLKEELPDYRVYAAHLEMDYILGFNQLNNQLVPIQMLTDRVGEILQNADFSQSVAMLETSYLANKSGTLQIPLPSALTALVQNSIQSTNRHNSRIQILSIRKSVPATILTQVLASIRKRLLDFMLKLEEEFGEEVDITSLREKNPQITTIVNTTINNTGHGNVTNTGDNATVNAHINIQQGNFRSLSDALRANRVVEADIVELEEIIQSDLVDQEAEKFGPRVNQWIQKMMGKALDGTWQVGIGVAGGLLVELIKAYYGIGK